MGVPGCMLLTLLRFVCMLNLAAQGSGNGLWPKSSVGTTLAQIGLKCFRSVGSHHQAGDQICQAMSD